MPIVFVHGVNVRDEAFGLPPEAPSKYRDQVKLRDQTFKAYLFGRYAHNPIGIADPIIRNPYWGDLGVSFKFNYISLPSWHEQLGESDLLADEMAGLVTSQFALEPIKDLIERRDERRLMLLLANKSATDFINLIFLAAADQQLTDKEREQMAALSVLASRLETDRPGLLVERLNKCESIRDMERAVIEALREVEKAASPNSEHEKLGKYDDPLNPFTDTFKHFALFLPKMMGRLTGVMARKPANKLVAAVIGDIIQYVKARGDANNPGAIVNRVMTDLIAANNERTSTNKLIVVAHSMGGNIVYDIATHFAPKLHPHLYIDFFITVGSQVGFFEEASVFHESKPVSNPQTKIKKPNNVGRWLNIYDPNDWLGYSIAGVFDDITEHSLSTGYGLAFSHLKYFVTPKLFRRIAEFVSE